MTKKKSNSNKPEEIRLKVTNWDEEVPMMVNRDHGSSGSRKVITRGVVRSNDEDVLIGSTDLGAEMLDIALDYLRKGFEFRFTDLDGEDALRLIPVVDKDMKTVSVVAQTMGSFRESLEDKIVTPFYRGKAIDPEEALKLREEVLNADKDKKRRAAAPKKGGVTPDIMVTCPNCGEAVRVGRCSTDKSVSVA